MPTIQTQMKRFSLFLALFTNLCIFYTSSFCQQVINEDYVHALYAKYPTIKSDFCPACKEWDNPFYKSIADTQRNMPLVTYYVYTQEHELLQEATKIDRKVGEGGKWHAVSGQPSLAQVYKNANKAIGKPNTIYEIALGHCQAWILLAWCIDGAILSDTYTFNEGAEFQGQNIGTEIATENLCRTLVGSYRNNKKNPVAAVTDSIHIWCGTYGSQGTYTDGKVTVTVPEYYWKIIKYHNKVTNTDVAQSWWMPNKVEEGQSLLPSREVTFQSLVQKLGFIPTDIFK